MSSYYLWITFYLHCIQQIDIKQAVDKQDININNEKPHFFHSIYQHIHTTSYYS